MKRKTLPKKGKAFQDIISQFSAKGSIPLKEPIKIFYQFPEKGLSSISFPISDDLELKTLFENSLPSGFGKGHQNVQDPTYRNAREVVANKMGISANYTEILKGICADISKIMGNGNNVRAELIKLNIYSEGCFFKEHVDSPKGSAFGSLVVFLPSYFEGGVLKIEHENEKFDYSFGGKDNLKYVNWVSFYNDCVHQITPVKKGFRLTLSYNLFHQQNGPIRSLIPNQKIVQRLISHLSDQTQYIYQCQHYYGNNALVSARTDPLKILKGKDAEIWLAAICTKLTISLDIFVKHEKYCEELNINYYDFYLGNPQKIKEIKAGTVDNQNYRDEIDSAFHLAQKNLELVVIPSDRTIQYLNKVQAKSQKYVYAIDGYYGNDYSIGEKYCELVISMRK